MNESGKRSTTVMIARMVAACLAVASGAVFFAASCGKPTLDPLDQQEAPIRVQTLAEDHPTHKMEILVKFRDDAKVKDIIDSFWRNASAAQAKFDAFKRARPEMADAALVRVTYSNELVLAFHLESPSHAGQLAEIRTIAGRLAASPDILYAEPDLTVQTGSG